MAQICQVKDGDHQMVDITKQATQGFTQDVLANADDGPSLEMRLDYKIMIFQATFQGLTAFLGEKAQISPQKSKPTGGWSGFWGEIW